MRSICETELDVKSGGRSCCSMTHKLRRVAVLRAILYMILLLISYAVRIVVYGMRLFAFSPTIKEACLLYMQLLLRPYTTNFSFGPFQKNHQWHTGEVTFALIAILNKNLGKCWPLRVVLSGARSLYSALYSGGSNLHHHDMHTTCVRVHAYVVACMREHL
jgi:hypothetical protein